MINRHSMSFPPLFIVLFLFILSSSLSSLSSAASIGDVVPTMYRLQLAGKRTDWMPWKHSASPRFATDQFHATVDTEWLLTGADKKKIKSGNSGIHGQLDWVRKEVPKVSDVKLQLSVDGDRFTSAWITVFERGNEDINNNNNNSNARYLSLLDINLVYWEGQVRGMQITPTYVSKIAQEEDSTESGLGLQDHIDVHYHWSQASTVDEQAGLRLVYIICFLGTLVVLGSSIRGLLRQT